MQRELPSNVARFEFLMYLSLAVGVVVSAIQWKTLIAEAAPIGGAAFVLAVQAFVFGLTVLMIWLVARRRKNWARWLLLIFFLLGAPGYVQMFPRIMNNRMSGALSLTQVVLQVVAFVLIFTGNGNGWFAEMTEGGRRTRDVV